MSAPRRVAVIGGGISGLAAAHRLVERGRESGQPLEVRLFEAGPRAGGVIRTERSDGFVIEAGPDSFLSEKPAALRLCERLGITDRLVGTREEFRRTYVVRDGCLRALPDGFLLMAPTRLWPLVTTPLFSWPGKLRMALDLVLPRGSGADESLADFVTRRLGREALERVAQPLVGGIYTADPQRLGLAATMPRFLEMERSARSIILAMWRQQRAAAQRSAGSGARWSLFLSFDGGLQCLVDELVRHLPDSTVQLERPIRALERLADGAWRLDGAFECDAVVVATPAHAAAALLRPLDATLGGELDAIHYASSATVTLAFRREEIPHPLDGFGFVVPHAEHRALLAGTFSNLKYPGRAPAEWLLVRAFIGGALQPELVELDDEALTAAVRRELETLIGVRAAPHLIRIARWRRAMPQYQVGHLERVARIRARAAALGVHLAGNGYEGVGIPDCIRSGESAAEATLADLPV
ncbi:MAG TPA: protoporphyrinogen oxidase [Candidatus Dormibacteraeota bacterium]|nr:protoporphyrinogen oxidase [Candidatus Dormibacteraeota bacterium]